MSVCIQTQVPTVPLALRVIQQRTSSLALCVSLAHLRMQVESGEAASIAEQLRSLKVSRVHNYEMPRPEWCSDQDEPRVLQVHIAIAQKLLGWQSVHGWKRYTGIGDVD